MKKILSIVICAIFLTGSALAQVTTAYLSGVVTNGNAAVENATIKAVLTTTNAVYTASSRSGGVYDISNLNAGGPYTVTISSPGQKDIVFTDVFLTLGENFKLDADFTTEKIGGVVVSVSRNATKTGSNLNINSRTLNTLPTISRSINDFTRLTPQAGSGSSFNGRDGRFNNITIDGDTSTNDSFIVMATGQSPVRIQNKSDPSYSAFREGLISLSRQLAQMIVRDGEGATKFMTIRVKGGRNSAECKRIAKSIAHSPLVKTAFFASDPNLGRILAAIGYAGVDDLDSTKVQLWLGDVWVAKDGGRNPEYKEADGQAIMKQAEITVTVDLGRGNVEETVWTCDLSHEYVSINADYRS